MGCCVGFGFLVLSGAGSSPLLSVGAGAWVAGGSVGVGAFVGLIVAVAVGKILGTEVFVAVGSNAGEDPPGCSVEVGASVLVAVEVGVVVDVDVKVAVGSQVLV